MTRCDGLVWTRASRKLWSITFCVLCIFFHSCLIRCLSTRDKVARPARWKSDYDLFECKSTTIEFTNVASDVNGSFVALCDQSGLGGVCAEKIIECLQWITVTTRMLFLRVPLQGQKTHDARINYQLRIVTLMASIPDPLVISSKRFPLEIRITLT